MSQFGTGETSRKAFWTAVYKISFQNVPNWDKKVIR